MNFEEALKIVNKAIYEKEGRGLTDPEAVVLKGSWENLTYEEMAEKFPYTANYLKGDMGHKFWKLLSEALGESVSKRNFKAALERARSRFLVEVENEVPDEQTQIEQSTTKTMPVSKSDENLSESSSSTEKPKVWQIVLELDKLDDIEPIIKQLEKLGEGSMTVKRIDKGSIVLTIETDPEFYERISRLFNSGQLTEILGIPLLQIRPPQEKKVTNLSGWFEDIFEIGWQTVEKILGPPQFAVRKRPVSVERAKLLNLETAGEHIALLVEVRSQTETEMDIRVAVYPSANQTYLPEMLELSVLDEAGEEVMHAIAITGDCNIQLHFSGELEERFSLKVALGEVNVIETFVI